MEKTSADKNKTAETTHTGSKSELDDLLDCPFCRSDILEFVSRTMGAYKKEMAKVRCMRCGALGPMQYLEGNDDINWNTRGNLNNLRINMKKQVDELRIRDALFDRAVDGDDELNITIEERGACGEDIDIWINKDEARKIVTHLKIVFGV